MQVEDLVVAFTNRNRTPGEPAQLRAVDGVSFDIRAGEVFGLVGESGSGKTTLGKAMLRLYRPSEGRIRFAGTDITALGDSGMRPYRRDLQMIFQDPLSSFNPRTKAFNPCSRGMAASCRGDVRCLADDISISSRKLPSSSSRMT